MIIASSLNFGGGATWNRSAKEGRNPVGTAGKAANGTGKSRSKSTKAEKREGEDDDSWNEVDDDVDQDAKLRNVGLPRSPSDATSAANPLSRGLTRVWLI